MSDNTLIAAEVVAAFVTHNSVPASDLPALIHAVVAAFESLGKVPVVEEALPKPVPAVPVRRSIHDEYLISLETGERFQTLKRHLGGLGMTPDEYREKWGLPHDYPMTAKGYSERRSALAKSLGLGRKPSEPVAAPAKVRKQGSKASAVVEVPVTTPASVQESSEAVPAADKARANTTAPAATEAPSTPPESPAEPAGAQQHAA